jgi:hypothetical protein
VTIAVPSLSWPGSVTDGIAEMRWIKKLPPGGPPNAIWFARPSRQWRRRRRNLRPPEPAPAWGAEGQDRIEDGDGAFAVLAAMALACARAAAPIVDAVATIPMVMQFAAGDLGAPSGFTAAPDRADRGRQALRQALRNGAAILAAMSCATSSSLCRYARSGFPRESQRSPRTL